jgi:hypothetical protein
VLEQAVAQVLVLVPVPVAHTASPAAGFRLREIGERLLHLIIVSRSLGDRP